MPFRVVTPPAEEPVSLVEAKAHLREDGSDHDLEIGLLVSAARDHIEDVCGVYFAQQVVEATFGTFPPREIQLRRPVISIDSVTYDDIDGVEQTVDAEGYINDLAGWVIPLNDWPATREAASSVRIRFTVGYEDAADVPAPIKAAILLLVGHWYANKEAVIVGKTAVEAPMSVKALIAPYRDWAV
jgi:uncharacterized phiE125 gp8 family phage protein